MAEIEIINLTEEWREWANCMLAEHWCSTEIMSRFRWFDLTKLPGVVAVETHSLTATSGRGLGGQSPPLVHQRPALVNQRPALVEQSMSPVGLATYHIENGECELITLNSFKENCGVGAALFFRVRELALEAGCTRYFLTTSNDNLRAMQFYQKRGMRMVKIHVGAIDAARERVAGIPLVGANGVPCRDEVEMEETLSAEATT